MGRIQRGGQVMNEPQIKINVSFKIIPFGHAYIEIKGREEEKEIKEKKRYPMPVYVEPTTSPHLIRITYDEKNYIIPKTTCGLF